MEEKKPELSHYQLLAASQKKKEENKDRYMQKSKKRLSNIITTKVKTSFIGSISACENHFGILWGHGKNDEELDDNEIAMREIWEDVRAQILDNGNTQLRAAMNEIEDYTISWNRYSIKMPVKDQELDQ